MLCRDHATEGADPTVLSYYTLERKCPANKNFKIIL